MSELLDTLQRLAEDWPDNTGAPYVLGEEHIRAFREAADEIERLRAGIGDSLEQLNLEDPDFDRVFAVLEGLLQIKRDK